MAVATLRPQAYATSPNWGGLPLTSGFNGTNMIAVGDTDPAVCVQVASDGKSLSYGPNGAQGAGSIFGWYWEDPGALVLPTAATIDSVQISIRHHVLNTTIVTAGGTNGEFVNFGLDAEGPPFAQIATDLLSADDPHTFGYQINSSIAFTTNPATTNPWTRAELFSDNDANDNSGGGWFLQSALQDLVTAFYEIDQVSLVVHYTAALNAWYYNPSTEHYTYSTDPGAPWVANTPSLAAVDTRVPLTVVNDVEDALTTVDNKPSATLFTPGIGCSSGGMSVAITGSGFGDGAAVTFGAVAATSVLVVNAHLITCVTPAHADGAVNVVITNADSTTTTITNGFTYGTPWWQREIIVVIDREIFTFFVDVQACFPPDTGIWVLQSIATPSFVWWYNVDFGMNAYQVITPGVGWSNVGGSPTAASPNGWYTSPIAFGGSIGIVSGSRPKDPRSWANIATWATGNRGMLGGAPAASVIFENHLVYPASDYVVGTSYPTIRVFDGSFDHELCKLPPTTLNVVPKAVMAMLPANGQIYLTSYDSGTTSADWLGRVFSLDLNSGVLTLLGAQFAAGEMPYALAWHMGRLWCGTNNGIGTVGKVYYFRPGIDTTWTQDYSLATSSVGGVDSMCSYKGKLYVGSDGAAGTFSKILVRDSAGAYTTSHTASGGTARINNGHIALTQFGENLYASYWNNDTTAVSLLKKFDNSSWSTVYTPATTNIRPYIVLFEDTDRLFAIGGGHTLSGALVSSANGTSWLNLTPSIPESSKTLLPIYGVEIL